MFHGAFADSVARFAADPEVDALAKGLAVAHAPAQTATGRYSVVNGRAGVGFDPDRMRNTVVTIRIGQGHGSGDRKSVVSGKSVSVRVDLGGRRHIKKKNNTKTYTNRYKVHLN